MVWAERVRRWGKSGLTAREFAAQLGVNASTLAFWKYKLGKEQRGGRAPRSALLPVQFVEVTGAVPGGHSGAATDERLEVVCTGGRVVRVPRSFDAETLRRLVTVLESR